MSHIIVTEAQASQIRGDYGIPRGTDNTPPARIEPVKTPDGQFIIPEACIGAFGLEAVKNIIEQMVTVDNVQEIINLPLMGQPCEKDRLYKYYEGTEDGYNGLVKCVQSHTRTEHKPMDIPALFSFFRENTDELEWIQNEWVELGWKRMYGGKQYEVIQSHQTLSYWTPDVTPALWKLVSSPFQEWTYPVSYSVNDIVTYLGLTYKCLQAHTSIQTWSPPNVPALWALQ